MATDSRTLMVQSAALLLRERGLSGMSFRDVIERSGAPRGSIYHHFPEGKRQLVREAVELSGRWVADSIDALNEGGDPVVTLHAFLAVWAEILRASDFRAGCPVVAVSVEANDDEPEITAAAAAAFSHWTRTLAEGLEHSGLAPARARALATLTVAAVEGAVVLSRAQRSTAPLEEVGAELEASLRGALAS